MPLCGLGPAENGEGNGRRRNVKIDADMRRKLTTNSRLVNDILAAYINTYKALCELINNSIQAGAKNIRLTIDYTDENTITPLPVSRIVLWDIHRMPIRGRMRYYH